MRTRTRLVVLAAAGALAAVAPSFPARAEDPAVLEEAVAYKEGETACEGWIAKRNHQSGSRPAVIVFHDWMGMGLFAKAKARALAEMGYVGFAADVYGKDLRPKDASEAGKASAKFKLDRDLMRRRVTAAYEAVRGDPDVDPLRVAAIGYCFGGTAALDLARSGADLAAVVSFHDGLAPPTGVEAKPFKAKALVLHGADDPHVKAAEVTTFMDEMRAGGVDWQLVHYGGAVHAFTNPDANAKAMGAAYDAKADRRSWQAMKTFFEETLTYR
jgi:dienelactone hydrolase